MVHMSATVTATVIGADPRTMIVLTSATVTGAALDTMSVATTVHTKLQTAFVDRHCTRLAALAATIAIAWAIWSKTVVKRRVLTKNKTRKLLPLCKPPLNASLAPEPGPAVTIGVHLQDPSQAGPRVRLHVPLAVSISRQKTGIKASPAPPIAIPCGADREC
jgi:hypothetical protein